MNEIMQKDGRIIAEYKEAYKVKNDNGEFLARITGKHIFESLSREDYPAVGDWVIIDELADNQAVIREILPRKTVIKRRHGKNNEIQIIATNIDIAFVVESIGRDYNLNRFERYFSIITDGGAKPAIIINKIDLISSDELSEKISALKQRFPDVDIIGTSTVNNEGLNDLKKYIENGKTYCFLGSSGVGKSSLINKLIGDDKIKTGSISLYSERGRHITTNRQMYFLDNGGIVIDNPGIREVGIINSSDGINNSFDEILDLSIDCKYNDCTHVHESGCAVLKALELGKLDKAKYLNYINLKKESDFYDMSEKEKRDKDKKFGKFLKKSKKYFNKYDYK